MQKVRSFFQCVGAVGHHDASYIVSRQMVLNAISQRRPHLKRHVLAVDLRHLLGLNIAIQPSDSANQLRNAQLSGGVVNVVQSMGSQASDGAAGAQNHDFFVGHQTNIKKELAIV